MGSWYINRLFTSLTTLCLILFVLNADVDADCDVSLVYRSLNGTCTNTANSEWGALGSALTSRKTSLNTRTFVKGTNFPHPRTVSNVIAHQDENEDIPNSRGLSSFLVFFGQFLDHCFALTRENKKEKETETINIEIPPDDEFFGSINQNFKTIHMIRSKRTKIPGSSIERPEIDFTSAIDVTAVYGVDENRLGFLRTNTSGLLITYKDSDLLPLNSPGFPNFPDDHDKDSGKDRFLAGDERSNENDVLLSIHTLFFREHNRIAKKLHGDGACSGLYPTECDEKIFQLARRFNGLQFQKIVFEEFIPALTSLNIPYSGYNPGTNPSMSVVFTTAAYRFGHSMIPEQIVLKGPNNVVTNNIIGEPVPSVRLNETFGGSSNRFINDRRLVDKFLRGSIFSISQELDTKVVNSLRNLLFSGIFQDINPELVRTDLLAVNIQRSRDHGLPCFNEIRSMYNLPKLSNFNELTSDSVLAKKIGDVYSSINYLDAWIGLMAEDKQDGSMFGETMLAIWKDEFHRMAHGDYFHYRNWESYPDGIRSFSEYSNLKNGKNLMQKIITSNTGITDAEIGTSVWIADSDAINPVCTGANPPVSCGGLDASTCE